MYNMTCVYRKSELFEDSGNPSVGVLRVIFRRKPCFPLFVFKTILYTRTRPKKLYMYTRDQPLQHVRLLGVRGGGERK